MEPGVRFCIVEEDVVENEGVKDIVAPLVSTDGWGVQADEGHGEGTKGSRGPSPGRWGKWGLGLLGRR